MVISLTRNTGFLYPELPNYYSVQGIDPNEIYSQIVRYAAELKFLLEQRDTQINLAPATRIYPVVTLSDIGNPSEGDIAYSASTGQYAGYSDNIGWQFWNNGNLPNPRGYYGSFYTDSTTCVTSVGAVYPVSLTTDGGAYGVSVSGSHIEFPYTGIYNIQISGQFANSLAAIANAATWFRKNGTNIAETASYMAVPAKHAGSDGYTLLAMNVITTISAGDYIELIWAGDSTGISLKTITSAFVSGAPNSPAMILTVTQV